MENVIHLVRHSLMLPQDKRYEHMHKIVLALIELQPNRELASNLMDVIVYKFRNLMKVGYSMTYTQVLFHVYFWHGVCEYHDTDYCLKFTTPDPSSEYILCPYHSQYMYRTWLALIKQFDCWDLVDLIMECLFTYRKNNIYDTIDVDIREISISHSLPHLARRLRRV